MAYSEELAGRVRKQLGRRAGLAQKKMFGGLGFLINGNLSVAIRADELLVRVDPADSDAALKEPGARLFDMGGRTMKGWLLVDGAAVAEDAALQDWVARGTTYASTLPPK